MGNFTITRWACDRCGVEYSERPKLPESVTLTAIETLEWAGGPVFQWKEMCRPCNAAVRVAIDAIKREGQEAARVVKEGNAA